MPIKILPVYIRDRIAMIKAKTWLSKDVRQRLINEVLEEYEQNHPKDPE